MRIAVPETTRLTGIVFLKYALLSNIGKRGFCTDTALLGSRRQSLHEVLLEVDVYSHPPLGMEFLAGEF